MISYLFLEGALVQIPNFLVEFPRPPTFRVTPPETEMFTCLCSRVLVYSIWMVVLWMPWLWKNSYKFF